MVGWNNGSGEKRSKIKNKLISNVVAVPTG
jgi:hypothetical protein